jgi:hypothetical protein
VFAIEDSPVEFAATRLGRSNQSGHLLTGFTCQFAENCGVMSGLQDVSLAAQEPSPMAGAAEGV